MGRSLGVADSTACRMVNNVEYTASMVTQKFYFCTRTENVVDIRGATRVAGSGGACTLQFFKAASGVAVGSGTLLHAGTFNIVGTADTNQVLTLVTDPSVLLLQPGDSVGYVLTGTPTSAVGTFQVSVEPA